MALLAHVLELCASSMRYFHLLFLAIVAHAKQATLEQFPTAFGVQWTMQLM